MIKGFEKRTRPLNKEEMRVANHLFMLFKLTPKFRKNNIIRSELKRVFNIRVTAARLRAIIHYMRCELCGSHGYVIATKKGYKYSNDLKELRDYEEAINARINSQLEIYNELVRRIRWIKIQKRGENESLRIK